MTVNELLCVLGAIPAEFRDLDVKYTFHRDVKTVGMVIIDPGNFGWQNEGAVYLSSGDDARATAAALIRVISIPPAPTAGTCLHCGAKGWFLTKLPGEAANYLARCAHCNADGHIPEPDFDNE
jgi:hypothetical protein